MKVSVDDQEIFTVSDVWKEVMCHDLHRDQLEEEVKRRLFWIIETKFQGCFERLYREWEEKLKERYESIPTNIDALAQLILSQPDYLCRKGREAQERSKQQATEKEQETEATEE